MAKNAAETKSKSCHCLGLRFDMGRLRLPIFLDLIKWASGDGVWLSWVLFCFKKNMRTLLFLGCFWLRERERERERDF